MLGHVIIKVKKDIFLMRFDHGHMMKVIKKQGDDYLVKIKYEDRAILDQFNHEHIRYSGLIHYLYLLRHNLSVLVGILIFASILYVNSISIQRIEFNAETEDNKQIEAIIRDHMTTVLTVSFLDTDLNELNLRLRKDFSDYEWIDVRRDGTILKVTVLKPSIINKQIVEQDGHGDLIATKAGFITEFQVEHGVVTVTRKQYVSPGQVLVSGNLCVNRPEWEPFYIRASGQVYARVHYTPTITIKKEEVESQLTGKITTNKALNLFGWDINYSNDPVNYDDYVKEVVEKPLTLFNFELPLSVKKIHYYEKNDIIKIYDEKTAYEAALSLAKKEILSHFGDEDVLLETIDLGKKESPDQFSFRFLIVTKENIAVFQRRHVNEQ